MNSSAQLRQEKLNERDEYLLDLIKARTPIAAIAQLIGVHQDYCKDLIKMLCRREGLAYEPTDEDPKKLPVGVTEDSRKFRAKLGDYLYGVRQENHYIQIGIDTGLLNKAQAQASELPFNYDWRLGQMERLARRINIPFKEMMLRALLTEQEYDYLSKCWTN